MAAVAERPGMKTNETVRVGGAVGVLVLVCSVPSIVVAFTPLSAAAPILLAGVVPSVVACLYDRRLLAYTAVAAALLIGLVELAGARPWAITLVMVVAGLVIGLVAERGWRMIGVQTVVLQTTMLTAPPILLPGVGWTSQWAGRVLLPIAMVLLGGLWALVVVALLGKRLPTLDATPIGRTQALLYGIGLALTLGLTTWISAVWLVGTMAGWMQLTVLMVQSPVISQTRKRIVDRSVGTIAGALAAGVIAVVVPWDTLLVLIGVVAAVHSMALITLKASYARFAFWLTAGVILVNAAGDNLASADIQRVIFTVGTGVLVAGLLVVLEAFRKVFSARCDDVDQEPSSVTPE